MRNKALLSIILVAACLPIACAVKVNRPPEVNYYLSPEFGPLKKGKIAILDFKSISPGSPAEGVNAANTMAMVLLKQGMDVMERELLLKLLAEQNLAFTDKMDITDAEALARIGKLVQADYVMVGALNSYSERWEYLPNQYDVITVALVGLSARVVDVKTAKICWVGVASKRHESLQGGLMSVCNELAMSLVDKYYVRPGKAKKKEKWQRKRDAKRQDLIEGKIRR